MGEPCRPERLPHRVGQRHPGTAEHQGGQHAAAFRPGRLHQPLGQGPAQIRHRGGRSAEHRELLHLELGGGTDTPQPFRRSGQQGMGSRLGLAQAALHRQPPAVLQRFAGGEPQLGAPHRQLQQGSTLTAARRLGITEQAAP